MPAERHTVMTLHNVTYRDSHAITRVDGVTLQINSGEILGIAAVEGNGQWELLRIIAGRLSPSQGTRQLHGETSNTTIVGFVPEDRHRDALILDFPLYENVALLGAGHRTGTMAWHTLRDETDDVISQYDVRARGNTTRARTLSGGNQQKLVVGRELHARPSVLVAENPSRGLDIHATAAVHARLRDARNAGTAIILYSSDLDEVLALADRMIVMRNGVASHVPIERDLVGRAMIGAV